MFLILKHLNYPSSILNRNSTNFSFNYFKNFKTFKISFKYPKQKSYFHFFINYFFLILKLSFQYPKQKS